MQQAIPTGQPDLSSLFQYAPALAYGQLGDMQRVANQNNQALQQAFQNQENFNQQKRPLDLQSLHAATGETNARGALIGAQARNQNLAGDFTQATQPGAIGVTNAQNKTKLSDEDIKQLENTGDLYRQAAAASALETTPWGRAAAAKKVLSAHLTQGPELDQFLMKHADNLPQYLADLGGNIYGASRSARDAATKQEAEQKRAETLVGGQKEVASIGAQSRENVADTNKSAKLQGILDKASTDQKNRGAALAAQANAETDPQRKADLYRQADIANAIYAHSQEIAAQARNETGIAASQLIGTATPPKSPLPSAAPQLEQPQQSQSGKPVETQGMQSPTDMIRKAFGEYNPDQYDYRIGPNGQPQRKKK